MNKGNLAYQLRRGILGSTDLLVSQGNKVRGVKEVTKEIVDLLVFLDVLVREVQEGSVAEQEIKDPRAAEVRRVLLDNLDVQETLVYLVNLDPQGPRGIVAQMVYRVLQGLMVPEDSWEKWVSQE